MTLSLAVPQQVAGRAVEGRAQLRQGIRVDAFGDGLAHQVIERLSCQPRQGCETVPRQPPPLGDVRELPAYRHGVSIALTERLDNRQSSVYYSGVPQRISLMPATTRRQAALQSFTPEARQARRRQRTTGPRYSVQSAGFPRELWLVWDHLRGDNLRGAELDAKNPPSVPWFANAKTAQRIVDRLNRSTP